MSTSITMTEARELLQCPISLKLMKNPAYISICDHTFEKSKILLWVSTPKRDGNDSLCPLCRRVITTDDVKDDRLLKTATAILRIPKNSKLHNVSDITDTKQKETVTEALTQMENLRRADRVAEISYQLTLVEKMTVYANDTSESCIEASEESVAFVKNLFNSIYQSISDLYTGIFDPLPRPIYSNHSNSTDDFIYTDTSRFLRRL